MLSMDISQTRRVPQVSPFLAGSIKGDVKRKHFFPDTKQLDAQAGWPTFAPLFFAKVGSRGLMQRRASFSSSPVPTEIKDLAGHPQNPINPKRDRLVESHLSKTKGGPPAR